MPTTDDTDVDRGEEPPSEVPRTDDGDSPVVFEFAVPTEAFALAESLREFPDVVVEFERLVPANHTPMPYLWASDGESPEFRDALEADPRVDACRTAATFDYGALYRLEWTWTGDELLGWLADSHEDVALLEAEGRDEEWTLTLRFPNRSVLTEFQTRYREWDCDLRVVRLYDLTEPKLGQYNVTEKQREALVRALEMGHFEIPREATLADVAGSLDISPKSTSERLRRGQSNLVTHALTVGRPTGVGLDGR